MLLRLKIISYYGAFSALMIVNKRIKQGNLGF